MAGALVICIGNVARRDDGAAHAVAALLAECLPSDAHLLTAVDLDIAMAVDVAQADLVVLVDAQKREGAPVVVTVAAPAPSASPTGHSIDVGGLLALAGAVYGAVPVCHVVSVAGSDFGHGEGLSENTKAASEEAAREVLRLVSG